MDENKYYKVYTNIFDKNKFNVTLHLDNGVILTLKKVHFIEVPLEKLYALINTANGRDFHYTDQSGIAFLYCPINKLEEHTYYFTNYNGKISINKLYGSNRCSLGYCELGLYLYKNNTSPDKLNQGGTIDNALYIALKAGPGMALIFHHVKIYKDAFPLVPCPYINWILKLFETSFVPSYYVNRDTIELKEDFDRHRLVPAFMQTYQKVGLFHELMPAFICGNIKQQENSDVPVGFQIIKSNEPSPTGSVKTDNDKILCMNQDISKYYLFGFLNNTYNIDSDVPIMKYLKNDFKFYSEQIIYAYDHEEVLRDREKALQSKDPSPKASLFDRAYFDNQIYYYKPICYGKVNNKSAILKPKVSSIVQRESGEMVFKIANQGVNAGSKISCHAVVDDDYNGRFSEFYAKRYRTKIQRIKDSKGQPVNENKVYEIPIIDDADKFYGTYKCELENPGSVDLILEKEFVILPGEALIYKKDIYISSNDKDALKCDLKSKENLELSELRVNIDDEKILKYNYFEKEESNEIFKLKKDYVTYKPSSFKDLKNGTVLSCIFGLPGGNNSLYITTYYLKDVETSDSNDDSSNTKMFIIIGCAAGGLVIFIIIIAIIIVVIKKKKTAPLQKTTTQLKNTATLQNSPKKTGNFAAQSIPSPDSSKKNKKKWPLKCANDIPGFLKGSPLKGSPNAKSTSPQKNIK
uniref:Ig-like domain-containing protein n=1 Tax=Strongyloides stercoralis TaxID=6248 RepID=A0A0K0EMG0_STRER